jgi:hypothetical protein
VGKLRQVLWYVDKEAGILSREIFIGFLSQNNPAPAILLDRLCLAWSGRCGSGSWNVVYLWNVPQIVLYCSYMQIGQKGPQGALGPLLLEFRIDALRSLLWTVARELGLYVLNIARIQSMARWLDSSCLSFYT